MATFEIDISDDEEQPTYHDLREILQPVVTRVVDALGGIEDGTYRMGDQVMGCLRDLKKLWRRDESDDDRTVARLLWESRVLMNDLVPILLCTAGQGLVEDKRAIACVDMITAMTWPIDMAEELKELDDVLDRGADFTQLQESHRVYKAALVNPDVLNSLFGILLACLAKPLQQRQERDIQVINVVLHLIRNLAFIKDPPINTHLSADQAQFSSLQTKLIKGLSESKIFHILLSIASNTSNDPMINGWNTLALEIFYLFYRGVRPVTLANDQNKQSTAKLQSLLANEQKAKQEVARKASTRHSRFGTTISVSLNSNKRHPSSSSTSAGVSTEAASRESQSSAFILHRQQALTKESGTIMDMVKKQAPKKVKKIDELTREDNLSVEARKLLQGLAIEILDAAFNPFLASLLKDIRSERPKITEKDHLRLLYLTKWFVQFFLAMRADAVANQDEARWNFGLIAEVLERHWIIWVLKRMREAVDEKPKLWTELQAGIECLTQLLLLIDLMASTEISDPTMREAADVLQHQLIYNGEILDIAFDSLRLYKEGIQSLVYLDASVHLSYALIRMLEKWGKGDNVYVRTKARRKKKATHDNMEEDDTAMEPDKEEVVTEALFSFETFQMKFAHADIAHTLLLYLARYQEFPSSECMRRVVSLMHRQVVKSKAEGLYFQVSTLDLFKSLLDVQSSFPNEQPYKDLVSVINFVLRQFFKALEKDSFLAIEALFPKNRGQWKGFSSWEPAPKSNPRRGQNDADSASEDGSSQEVQVKRGHSWTEQVGIVVACLVENGHRDLVDWTISILDRVLKERYAIIQETDNADQITAGKDLDGVAGGQEHEVGDGPSFSTNVPSMEALAKVANFTVTYTGEDADKHAEAATKNAYLKLLFRLCKWHVADEDTDEFEWYIPAATPLSEVDTCRNVIQQFLETPIELENGKKPSQCISKKTRWRRRPGRGNEGGGSRKGRRARSTSSLTDSGEQTASEQSSDGEDDGDEGRGKRPKRKRGKGKKRQEQKAKEEAKYKSAQFIDDSDDEYTQGDEGWEAFLAKEAEKRQQAASMAVSAHGTKISTMRSTGTKKRRRKVGDAGGQEEDRPRRQKRRKSTIAQLSESERDSDNDDDSTTGDESDHRPQPRPRPRTKGVLKEPTPPEAEENEE